MMQNWLHEREPRWMAILSLFIVLLLLLLLSTNSYILSKATSCAQVNDTYIFDHHHMESSNNAHNKKTPGATATGAETGGTNTLVVVDKVASTRASRLDCDDSDPVRHDLHIPNTADADGAMSTIGFSPSSSISGDALMAGTKAVLNRDLMEVQERDAKHGRHGAQKRQKRDLETIPNAMQDTVAAAASSSANTTANDDDAGMRELGSAPTFLIEQGMRTVIAADESSQVTVAQAHADDLSVTMEPNQLPQQNTTTRDQEDTGG
jgi:hypothetical protein